jgi:hypothetical protein
VMKRIKEHTELFAETLDFKSYYANDHDKVIVLISRSCIVSAIYRDEQTYESAKAEKKRKAEEFNNGVAG